MSAILDINGNPTGLVERVLYYIQNSERAQLLQAHHSTNPDEDHNVSAAQPASGGSTWHRDNECVWSFHAVPTSKRRKYYVVTSGKILHAGHGIGDNTNDRKKSSHIVDGLGKIGGSDWHKNGPESHWQFEDRGSRKFRISTSHKSLWFPSSKNKNNDVRGLNRQNNNGHDSNLNSNECSWKIIPLPVMYESKIEKFNASDPFVGIDTASDRFEAKVFFETRFSNSNPAEGITGSEYRQAFAHTETYVEATTVTFSSSKSITLNSKASVAVKAEVPGFGGITTTVETGRELANSLTDTNSMTITKTNQQSWTTEVTIFPGSSGKLTVLYYRGEFNIDFMADVTLQARLKVAPRECLSTEVPTLEYAFDDMLKAALKDGGFDKPDSQVTYVGRTAKFQESGNMKGAGGYLLDTDITYDEGSRQMVITKETSS